MIFSRLRQSVNQTSCKELGFGTARTRRFPAVVLLFLLLSAFKCSGDSLSRAARAADDIAGSVKAMIDVKRELATTQAITPSEELVLTELLLKVNSADKALVVRLKSIKGQPNSAGGAEILVIFRELNLTIQDLNSQGVLGIKNPAARKRVQVLFAAIDASLATIEAFINGDE